MFFVMKILIKSWLRSPLIWSLVQFLELYSKIHIMYRNRIYNAMNLIFSSTDVKLSSKVAGLYLLYNLKTHPSELIGWYFNTFDRDGYLPIRKMLRKYKMSLCCECYDLSDMEENLKSSEGFLRRLIFDAHARVWRGKSCRWKLCGKEYDQLWIIGANN